MTEQKQGNELGTVRAEKGFLRRFLAVATPFWVSEEKWVAWGLLAIIVSLLLGDVYLALRLTEWDRDIFNSIQQMNREAGLQALKKWPVLIFFVILVEANSNYFIQKLRISQI